MPIFDSNAQAAIGNLVDRKLVDPIREALTALGCTQPAISQLEAGGASLSIGTLQRVADALGCDLPVAIVSRDVVFNQDVPAVLFPRSKS